GPGRNHAESARRTGPGALDRLVHMEDLGRAPRARIMQLCGRCHATESDPRPGDRATEVGLPRFQTTALARSRCYRQSAALTCLTCHDAHADVSHDTRGYEAICLRFH